MSFLANPRFNDRDWFRKDDLQLRGTGTEQQRRRSNRRLTRRAPLDSGVNLVSRPRATPTSPGCSTSSTTSPRKAWPASSSPMAACPPVSPGKGLSSLLSE